MRGCVMSGERVCYVSCVGVSCVLRGCVMCIERVCYVLCVMCGCVMCTERVCYVSCVDVSCVLRGCVKSPAETPSPTTHQNTSVPPPFHPK